jgi:hypothetical protein
MKKAAKKDKTRLIVATSEIDADLLYATQFFAPDPFIFLEQNGKRTLVLSDLEIDRGRKQARSCPTALVKKKCRGRVPRRQPTRKSSRIF